MRKIKLFILLGVFVLGMGQILRADDRYWRLPGGNGNWSVPNNWSLTSGGPPGGGVPLSTHTVILNGAAGSNGNLILDIPVSVSTLSIIGTYSGTFNAAGSSFTVYDLFEQSSGNVSLGTSVFELKGHFNRTGGSFSANLSTIVFSGPNIQSLQPGATSFRDLKIDKPSNAVEIQGPLILEGDLRIISGALDASPNSHPILVKGDWENFGNFIPHGSTVTFEPGMDSALSGNTSFYGLKAVTPGTTIFFAPNSTNTVFGKVDFGLVHLRSEMPGTQWFFHHFGSTQTLTNITVRDSNAAAGNVMAADGGSVDLGNNVNWTFGPGHPPPGSPTIANVTPNDIGVGFGPVSSEKGYLLESSTSPGFVPIFTASSTLDGNANLLQVSGLMLNTTYHLRVGSLWNDGTTTFASPLSTPTWAGIPAGVGSTFTAVLQTSMTVNWASGGNPFGTLFEVEVSTDNLFNGVIIATEGVNTFANITGLTPLTTYFSRVVAISHADIDSPWLNLGSTTTLPFPGPPPTFLNPFFPTVSSSTIQVSWGAGAPNYAVVLSTNAGFVPAISSFTLSGNTTSFVNLMPSTPYHFRVKVTTEPDTSYGPNSISTMTLPAAGGSPPLNPFFTFVGIDIVNVNWNNVGAANYLAVLSTDSLFNVVTDSTTVSYNNRNFTGLTSATTYFFKVKIATAPDINYSSTISTVTEAGGGNFALSFDGNNRIARTPTQAVFDFSSDATVEFWFKRHAHSGVIENLMGKENGALNRGWTIAIQNNGSVRFQVMGGPGVQTSNVITDNNWHHFAVSRNASSGFTQIYLDGDLRGSSTLNGIMFDSQDLKFGNSFGLTKDLNGTLDEIRVWNVIRTQGEIQTDRYNRMTGFESNLVAYWDLDEGVGQTALDRTPNGFLLTLGTVSGADSNDPFWVTDPIPGFGAPVDSIPPNILIQAPVNGSTQTVGGLTVISGSAQDNQFIDHVQISIQRLSDAKYWNSDGFGSGYWATGENFEFVGPPNNWVFPGHEVFWSTGTTYRIIAEVEDGGFNVARDTSTFYVDASTDSTPPQILIQYPVAGSTYSATQLTLLSGTASDNEALAVVGIQITRLSDGYTWDQFAGGGGNWTASTNTTNPATGKEYWSYSMPSGAWVSSGVYQLDAFAKDLANNAAVHVVTFQLNVSTNAGTDTILPNVFITHPASGTVHAPNALTSLYGTASDNVGVIEVAVNVQDLSSGLYWNGGTFGASGIVWHFPANLTNWNFSGVPSNYWVNGTTYTLTVRAKDAAANFGFKSSNFLVSSGTVGDTIPPNLVVNNPVNGNVYAPHTISFNGTAGDNVGLAAVKYSLARHDTGHYYDGVGFNSPSLLYHSVTPPLVSWNIYISSLAFTNANYTLVVVATDTSGLTTSVSVPFSISGASAVVDAVPPTISISTPTNGATYSDVSQLGLLSGVANDNVGLIEVAVSLKDDAGFYFNGYGWNSTAEIWEIVPGNLNNWSINFPILAWKNGNFTMRARAVDVGLNITYSSITFTISGSSGTGNADTQPPNSFIYNPPQGAVQGPYAFTHLNGHADDPFGIHEVLISLLRKGTSSYWTGSGFSSQSEVFLTPQISFSNAYVLDWYYDIPFSAYANGNYIFKVYARDPSLNTNIQTATFTVIGSGGGDLTAPLIQINSPANGGTFNESQMAVFSGTATDNVALQNIFITILQNNTGNFWNGANWISSETELLANGLSSWTYNNPLGMWANGGYTITAIAKDTSGNTARAIHSVTVSTSGAGGSPPTAAIQFPVNSSVYVSSSIVMFSGTAADDGTVVQVRLRFTDINMMWDWNPQTFIWEPNNYWFNATYAGGVWTSTNVPPLNPGHFRLSVQAIDNTGLVSLTSAVEFFVALSGGGGDFIPPARITGLTAVSGTTLGSVKLNWVAVGNDGHTGTAHAYTIKYRSGSPIQNESDWIAAQDVSVYPVNQTLAAPMVSGSPEQVTINNLIPGLAYFWAIRARDAAGNRGQISNSPLATAFGGCTAGTGDGQGTAVVSPGSFQELKLTTATVTFTVGNSGITAGGKILFKIPSGWVLPQSNFSGQPGYVSASASNGTVSISTTIQGPTVTIQVQSGTLNGGDTVTLTYLASPACGIQSGVRFEVLSQASSCGVLTAIASQPTVNVTAGPASWVGFDSIQKFVQPGVIKPFDVRGQNSCGSVAAVTANVNITASVVKWNATSGAWVIDSDAVLSLASNLSSPFTNQVVVLTNGSSLLPLYYRLDVSTDPNNHYVRILYNDLNNPANQSENLLQMIPNSNASGFTNVSVDLGTPGGALSNVTITPNGDGVDDIAFINFQTGNQTLPYQIQISNDGFSTILWERGGVGSPVREGWDGRRGTSPYNVLPSGTYAVRLTAGGIQNSSLGVTISATGLSGLVQDSNTSNPISNALVNVFGNIQRHTQTATDGTFNLVGLPNGVYQLEINKEGYGRYFQAITVSGNTNAGTISLGPEARVVLDISRADTSFEQYGSLIGSDGTQQFFATVHFAQGRSVPDDGFNSANLPTLFLRPGINHNVSLDFQGLSVPPLTALNLTAGQVYTWQPTLTENKKIAGTVRLPNGAVNNTGVNVGIAIGLDVNPADGRFDLGYPSFFANAFIPPYESQANYVTPGLTNGTYVVEVNAPGFSPQSRTALISGADANLDFTLDQGGTVNLTFTFDGSTTHLNKGDGTFDVILRISGSNAFFTTNIVNLNVSASASSQSVQVRGLPNGTFDINPEPLARYGLSLTGSNRVTVSGGVGAGTLAFQAFSGSVLGTVLLSGGSTMGDLAIQLVKDSTVLTSPTLGANTFNFIDLEPGRYDLTVLNNNTNATYVGAVFVNRGQQTPVSINLAGQTSYAISGTVGSIASPPYNTLPIINANSSPLTIYTAGGTQVLPALRVGAYLVKPDGTTASLPTISGQVLNPAEIRFGNVNPADGTYSINGLQQGKNYRVRLNPDFNSDGVRDIPLEEKIETLFANKTGVNFTIRDGASISGTLSVETSEIGQNLNVILTDVDLNEDIATRAVFLSGTSVAFAFPNLRVGRYLVRVVDTGTPQKYTVAPQFVSIGNTADQKTIAFALSQAGFIQLRLALATGELITAANVGSLLPSGFEIRFVGPDIKTVSIPNTNNRFKIAAIPNQPYEILIHPPNNQQTSGDGKGFLPMTLQGRAAAGQVDDKGTVVLQRGTNVTVTVTDVQGNGVGNVPVLVYQSLARSLPPRVAVTNNLGKVVIADMSPQNRFFDFVANPLIRTDRLSQYSEGSRTMIDITKPSDISNLSIVLQSVTGSIAGQINSSNGSNLIASFGNHYGLAGVSILVKQRGSQKVLEFKSNSDGSYSIPLPRGQYDLEFLAQNHRPHRLAGVSVGASLVNLDPISLVAGGVKLSGSIRNSDGSLPSQKKVDQLLAFDSSQTLFRAHRILETITAGVDRYEFHGLVPGTYDVVAIDDLGRLTVLSRAFVLPNQDTTLNLTFQIPQPTLVASFIQKLPAGVEAIFSSNQAFRNNPGDLNGNGIADDNEFDNFSDATKAPYVGIVRGNGSLAYNSVSADRKQAQYTYTLLNDPSSIELTAKFNTKETDPRTGANYQVSGNFSYPVGLKAQQRDTVTQLGKGFVLPGGSELNLQPGWHESAGTSGFEVGLEQADLLNEFVTGSSGLAAIKTAEKLGAAAYRPRMFKAIQTLASVPDVNPFSSFYDIFLPASVARVFTNSPTLTLKYDESVTDPATLNIYYFNETQGVYTLENTDRRIDTINRTISVSLGHASVFTVLASSAPIIRGDAFSGSLSVFNFPNPFDLKPKTVTLQNPGSNSTSQTTAGTMIKVSLPSQISGAIEIDIFTIAGELVTTLRETAGTPGAHYYMSWDGKNSSGKEVASGVYIGHLKIAGQEKFFKMVVLK